MSGNGGYGSYADGYRAALTAVLQRVQVIPPCPFDTYGNHGLKPSDPCPVCGDLGEIKGDYEDEVPSNCGSAVGVIRMMLAEFEE